MNQSQSPNINNITPTFNNQNSHSEEEPLNIMSNMNQTNSNQNKFINTNQFENVNPFKQQNPNKLLNNLQESSDMKNTSQMNNKNILLQDNKKTTDNHFINNNTFTETSLSDLNIEGNYTMEKADYMNDPKVQENIKNMEKNTIPVSQELKMVIIITLVLFVFIFIMPYIFDLFR